jgi:hypothetical protein
MKRRLPATLAVNVTLLVVSALLLAIPVFAHHGFQFEFDGSKYIYITGTLTKVEWENPHIYFNVESTASPENPAAADPSGKITTWRFEGSSASLVQRTGTRRADLIDSVGKSVTVRACPGKGAMAKGAAETVKLSGDREVVVGRKRYYGSGPVPGDIDKDPVN